MGADGVAHALAAGQQAQYGTTAKAWLPATTVRTGGHLVYTLGTALSLTWGSGSGDTPPQN